MSWRVVARREALDARRSRALQTVVGLFVAVGVSAVAIPAVTIGDGLAAEGALTFLVAPLRLVVGLTALLAGYGAVAGPRTGGQLKLVLGLPIRQSALVAGAFAGRAVVLTSHSPLDARLADRLVFVRDGRVVADAAPGALLEVLPPVVRLRGAVHEAVPRIAPLLRAGHSYGTGPELRGFLRRDRSVGEVAATVADCDVRVDRDEPTTVDLYEHLATVEAG